MCNRINNHLPSNAKESAAIAKLNDFLLWYKINRMRSVHNF